MTDPSDERNDDGVEQDDAIIGRALKGSLVVIGGVAAVAALIFFLLRRPDAEAPEQVIEAAAPEQVEQVDEAPAVRFTDITTEAGVDFVHFHGAKGEKLLPETMGGGVALFDYDGDGDLDLLFTNGESWPHHARTATTQRLYANDGKGKFTDVTAAAGLAISLYGMGVATGDYDADGDVDLYLTSVGRNVLLENDGGRFRDVTDRAGVGGEEIWSTGATFFDADGDSDLDLFVGNYVVWSKEIDLELDYRLTGVGRAYGPPVHYAGTDSVLYRNRGDGTFEDVSEPAGIRVANPATGQPVGKALGLAVVDVDRDGHLDLLVANDTVQNFFFRNLGDGTFEEIGEMSGVAYDRNGAATGGMGTDVGYYRNDEQLGFLIGNFANEMTSVYVSAGASGFFTDEAIPDGIGAPTRRVLSFGVLLFDYDLDGRLDLLQSNGHLEEQIATVDPSQSYAQPAQLFWNAGAQSPRSFVEVDGSTTGDLSQSIVGRGSAFGDIDGDGDLDVVLTQVGARPLLLRNDQELGHHWLRVELDSPNGSVIGSEVTVGAGGLEQTRIVSPTRSYLSQSDPAATFGLGSAATLDKVTVRWPDGTTESFDEAAVNRSLKLRRGSGKAPSG